MDIFQHFVHSNRRVWKDFGDEVLIEVVATLAFGRSPPIFDGSSVLEEITPKLVATAMLMVSFNSLHYLDSSNGIFRLSFLSSSGPVTQPNFYHFLLTRMKWHTLPCLSRSLSL